MDAKHLRRLAMRDALGKRDKPLALVVAPTPALPNFAELLAKRLRKES